MNTYRRMNSLQVDKQGKSIPRDENIYKGMEVLS